jgi:3-deoxy-D-manno-octulosonate 8-phosphate phosphatase (KDO 8-P phosphatase)
MQKLMAKAAKIRLLVTDVDGVLTNGHLYLGNNQEHYKGFSTLDGVGIKLLLKVGLKVAVLTGCKSKLVQNRMESLGVEYVYQGLENKVPAFNELLQQLNLEPEQVAYIGDDLPDLPLIVRAGLGIIVSNASKSIKPYADWQTQAAGGEGAVREVCDLLLKAQNHLPTIIEEYLS